MKCLAMLTAHWFSINAPTPSINNFLFTERIPWESQLLRMSILWITANTSKTYRTPDSPSFPIAFGIASLWVRVLILGSRRGL